MRKFALTIGLLFFTLVMSAQNPLSKGQLQLNAGLGFSNWGLPVYVGLDYGIHEDISVGGEICFHSYREKWDGYTYKHNIFGFAVNGNYHFNRLLNIPSNWDFYAGLNIGFNVWSSPSDYPGTYNSGLGLGAQIGGRYFFNDKFGVNLELGGGNAASGGRFGISYQF